MPMQVSLENTIKNADTFLRFFAAYVVIIFFIILDVQAYGSQSVQELKPLLSCLALFYWSVYRPTLIPIWLAFIFGLMIDVYGGYLGLNALGFTLIRFIISSQRRLFVGQPFINIFLGFSVAILLFYAMQWSVMAMLSGTMVSPILISMKIISAIVTFPAFVLFMRSVHRILPDEGGAVSVKQTVKPTLRR